MDLAAEPVEEPSLAVDRALALVEGAVMPATEKYEVVQPGRAAVGPVVDVVGVEEPALLAAGGSGSPGRAL